MEQTATMAAVWLGCLVTVVGTAFFLAMKNAKPKGSDAIRQRRKSQLEGFVNPQPEALRLRVPKLLADWHDEESLAEISNVDMMPPTASRDGQGWYVRWFLPLSASAFAGFDRTRLPNAIPIADNSQGHFFVDTTSGDDPTVRHVNYELNEEKEVASSITEFRTWQRVPLRKQ